MALLSKSKFGFSADKMPFGIHYSWVIVGVLAIVQIFGSSVFMIAGVMVPPLTDPEGGFRWGIGELSMAIALYYVFSAIFAPITGYLGDRYGARPMMFAGAVLYGVGMVALGFVTELWHFFLFYSFLMSFTASITMVPMMASISGWFRRSLGWGVGILWATGGIGTAVLAPLVAYLLDTIGWQATFTTVGLAGTGIMLLVFPLIRSKPADIGILPFGAASDGSEDRPRDRSMEALRLKVFNQHMRQTRAFWNLPIIHALGCAGMGIVLIYVIPLAVQEGLGLSAAALIITIISLVSITSRLGAPVLAEAFGPRKVMAVSLAIQSLTVLILLWAHDPWVFYLFAAAFGVGFGAEWTGYIEINRRYFGDGPMGTCYGWQMTGAFAGHAVTTFLAGLVIYVTGSFYPVFVLSAIFSAAGLVVIAMLDSTSHVLIPDWEESLPPEARSNFVPGAAGAGD
ncbi:MAG: MFS transporter [Chloroflexi bacterium]|nr:MFS transporter [Chloroflexota bacterium]MCI0830247.1 MFS transporter [Chloroflexota bacterium]MCI0849202.1 MFS transporter [Chloroflexota bacterium]MCI0897653.1 MFS transporter [Chloroflexota bacterium]MCI0900827.1 MFS transporter [Chloroflexota bacterium]